MRFLVVATVPEVALDMSGCLQHSWFDSGYMFVPVPVQFRRNSKGAVLGPRCRARFVQRHGSDRRRGDQHFWLISPRFLLIFGAPVSDTGAGGADITQESDSRVGPAHVNLSSDLHRP